MLWGTWYECSRVVYGREWLHRCNSNDKGLCQKNNSLFAVLEEFTPPQSGGPQVPLAPFPWHVAMAAAVNDLFANVWKKITRTTSFFAMYYIIAIPTPAIPTFLYIMDNVFLTSIYITTWGNHYVCSFNPWKASPLLRGTSYYHTKWTVGQATTPTIPTIFHYFDHMICVLGIVTHSKADHLPRSVTKQTSCHYHLPYWNQVV